MNRRSFLRNSALALFGFTVLPPAETYQRVWRAMRPEPEIYACIMDPPSPEYMLFSKMTVFENPSNELVIENFSISEVMDKVYEYRKDHPQPEILYA